MVILFELSRIIVVGMLASMYYKGYLKGWSNFPTTVFKKGSMSSKESLLEDCIKCVFHERRIR